LEKTGNISRKAPRKTNNKSRTTSCSGEKKDRNCPGAKVKPSIFKNSKGESEQSGKKKAHVKLIEADKRLRGDATEEHQNKSETRKSISAKLRAAHEEKNRLPGAVGSEGREGKCKEVS